MAGRRKRTPIDALTYQSYLAVIRQKSDIPRLKAPPATASVYVATCSGCAALSEKVGARICLINVSADPAASVAGLSERDHGGVLVDRAGGKRPFLVEPGWRDWRPVNLKSEMQIAAPLPSGISASSHALKVQLNAPNTIGTFRRQLLLVLAHLRFDEVLMRGAAVSRRFDAGRLLAVEPRFAVRDRAALMCDRVEDLFVFDPWADLHLLALYCLAASQGEGRS